MKNTISFLKKNPLFLLLSMVSIALFLFGGDDAGCTMMAAVTVATAGSGSTISRGIAGLTDHAHGTATTVSSASEISDLIEAETDEKIIAIASDESVIDTIKRRIKRKVVVSSFEVDHYMIDEKRSKAYTNATYTGIKATRAEIPFSTTGERKIFQDYYTAICKGVNGYDPTGQTELPGVDLMLFFVFD